MKVGFDFKGKKILVTGASQGIGLAIASRFVAAGGETYLLAENVKVLEAASQLARESGHRVHGVRCDISSEAEVMEALEDIQSLDVLVNNAGYQPRTPIEDISAEGLNEFRKALAVNVTGAWLVTRMAVTRMGLGGRIIFTSSIWGKTGAAEYSGYAASKHAVMGIMRSLAIELGPRGITVNCICPGWVETEGAMWTVRQIAERENRDPAELISDYLDRQPLPGIMSPADVADSYLFLASDAARDITGQALSVDRGHFIG